MRWEGTRNAMKALLIMRGVVMTRKMGSTSFILAITGHTMRTSQREIIQLVSLLEGVIQVLETLVQFSGHILRVYLAMIVEMEPRVYFGLLRMRVLTMVVKVGRMASIWT